MKIFNWILVLALAVGIVSFPENAAAQGGAGYDLKSHSYVVTDFNRWVGTSRTAVAAGAATITITNPWAVSIEGWAEGINPYVTGSNLLIDAENAAVDEVVTISGASCTTATSCTITATFGYAHAGQYTVRSGSYGVNESIAFALAHGGGEVVVPVGFGGATANITGAVGSTSVKVIDKRTGTMATYGWSGSAYVSLFGITNTGTTIVAPTLTSPLLAGAASPAATLTTVTGTAPALITLSNDSTPNFNQGNVAIGANAVGATIAGLKTRAATTAGPATTTIVTGDDLFEISAYGAEGTNYIKSAAIVFDSTGTIAATRVPSVIKFQTGTDAAPTVVTTALTLGADQSATLAGVATVQGASLTLGVAGTTAGSLKYTNATSGSVTFSAPTGALGTPTVTVPIQTGALPTAYFCGATSGNQACANAATGGTGRVFGGIATLSSNAAVISGISPAFTSTATFTCVANDLTTRANPVQVANTSSSSITITNTTGASDVINYMCVGY